MNTKRTYVIPKSASKYNGKLKDILSASRSKSESKPTETENNLANIPLVKQADTARLLPKYQAVLSRSSEDGVNMDELDQLQQDLEKLLSTSASRSRFLLAEIESIDRVEENRDKKDKSHDKAPLKRKRPDEKPKCKDVRSSGTRVFKKHCALPVNNLLGDGLRYEVPKLSLPKNDNSDKFWASIEPYCANVNAEDINFLDGLIKEFSKCIDAKVPEIGNHYAQEWSEELVSEEMNLGKSPKSKHGSTDGKKSGLAAFVDSLTNQHTQKLVAALIEEKVFAALPNIEKIKSDLNLKSNGPRVGVCMDKKLEQALLNLEELQKNPGDDEILTEIKKCQQELKSVNTYNLNELTKLRRVVQNDIQKQQVKEELEKVDNQVLDLYNRFLVAKKQAQQSDGIDFDKSSINQQVITSINQWEDILKWMGGDKVSKYEVCEKYKDKDKDKDQDQDVELSVMRREKSVGRRWRYRCQE
ncbi:transcriptional adapter 3-B isoform X2 [Aethina tumida]|uniref:transcriptional adapter 3-B isoform X2 n=1 Tax=Aethina tumida TaxID=116153 RepID=UPI00096B1BEA|nr:transcriptional adapter 3-B isoform X2 [Aethina tumida]